MKKLIILLGIVLVSMFIYCEKKNPVISSDKNQIPLNRSLLKSSTNINYTEVVFGPEIFTRLNGQPITEIRDINLINIESKYLFILDNGINDKNSKVTSCFVIINNDTIISPIEINKNVDIIKKEIFLSHENHIKVRLLGKPDSYLTLTILGVCNACPGTVTDIDGNIYQTKKIGDQCWMVDNLKVIRYRNGDNINNVIDNTNWINLTNGAYCNYENDVNNVPIYGRLYNWYAVIDNRNIAPTGWHVPNDAEWKKLEIYLGMSQVDADLDGLRGTSEGGKMKEIGIIHWQSPNTGATNESGFSAIPGGYRSFNGGGYRDLGYSAYFWSSTEYSPQWSWFRRLFYNYSGISRYNYAEKQVGFSIRCVKD